MLFNSYIFILLFLPIAVIGYFLLNRVRQYTLAKVFLIGMSLWFYGYFDPWYLFIIVGSVLVNFFLRRIFFDCENPARKKLGLALGLLLNLGALFIFKYYDFFIQNVNAVFRTNLPLLRLLLPLGISFFTFQQLSYVIDAYRGGVPRYGLVDYALFVVFFPQLIAGPIVRHSDTIPQFNDLRKKRIDYENFSKGVTAFTLGLAKKVLLADVFGNAVNAIYGQLYGAGTFDALLLIFAYTMQIYFDFSGYCDMATGLGLMLNINIPVNFNSPYKSLNVSEFWRRWHITLSAFFTEYVYIPLGGNRKGKVRTMINVMIVFLVSGLWHGADWTFVLWGAMHGVGVVVSRLVGRPKRKLWQIVSWAVTFVFINATWVFFRANSLSQATQVFAALGNWRGVMDSISGFAVKPFNTTAFQLVTKLVSPDFPYMGYIAAALFCIAGFYFSVLSRNTNERVAAFRPTTGRMLLTALLFVWSVLSLSGVSTFLYFNF